MRIGPWRPKGLPVVQPGDQSRGRARRLRAVLGAAVLVGRIATGDVEEVPRKQSEANVAAAGRLGGQKWAAALSATRRSEMRERELISGGKRGTNLEIFSQVCGLDSVGPTATLVHHRSDTGP
jgi:hypothetical protein